jgi:hypothetical protein
MDKRKRREMIIMMRAIAILMMQIDKIVIKIVILRARIRKRARKIHRAIKLATIAMLRAMQILIKIGRLLLKFKNFRFKNGSRFAS